MRARWLALSRYVGLVLLRLPPIEHTSSWGVTLAMCIKPTGATAASHGYVGSYSSCQADNLVVLRLEYRNAVGLSVCHNLAFGVAGD